MKCLNCHKEIRKRWRTQKYCKKCAKIRAKERNRKYNRRYGKYRRPNFKKPKYYKLNSGQWESKLRPCLGVLCRGRRKFRSTGYGNRQCPKCLRAIEVLVMCKGGANE